jgi:protein-S-isoprenylcysteine O-methyltransferase Ste14
MKQTFRKLRIKITQTIGYLLIAAIFLSTSAWENAHPFIGSLLFFFGVILLAIASFGRIWCSLYIGGFKTNSLISGGPYSLCRNPLYFFSFLGGIGIGLATETFFLHCSHSYLFHALLSLSNKSRRNCA